jgi:hypothetical protein
MTAKDRAVIKTNAIVPEWECARHGTAGLSAPIKEDRQSLQATFSVGQFEQPNAGWRFSY